MRTIGLLGGMGPAAGVDLAGRVVLAAQASGATVDADHPEMVLLSLPSIPSRIGWTSGGPSPVEALLDGVARLEDAGAEVFAVACHGAHAWWPEIVAHTKMDAVSMVDAGVAACAALRASSAVVLGSAATRRVGLWSAGLAGAGIVPLDPDPAEVDALIVDAKAGRLDPSRLDGILDRTGGDVAVLACTDLPPFMRDLPRVVDPTAATAFRLIAAARR